MKPKSVRIVGKDWSINWYPKLVGKVGECLRYRHRINVATRNIAAAEQQDTLMHEILHALSDTLRLRLKEKQVHPLAAGLIQVLHDNPKVAEYLTRKK